MNSYVCTVGRLLGPCQMAVVLVFVDGAGVLCKSLLLFVPSGVEVFNRLGDDVQ